MHFYIQFYSKIFVILSFILLNNRNLFYFLFFKIPFSFFFKFSRDKYQILISKNYGKCICKYLSNSIKNMSNVINL